MRSVTTFFLFLFAQSVAIAWDLVPVTHNKEVVGYIYHSYAKGTVVSDSSTKIVTGLRIICSTRPPQSNMPPILAIYWQSPVNISYDHKISVKVDDTEYKTGAWNMDSNLIFIPVSQAPELMSKLGNGKTVVFSWTDNKFTKYATGFDLKGFDISDFSAKCKVK